MGLKLQLHADDKILVGEDILVDVIATGKELILDISSALGVDGTFALGKGESLKLRHDCTMTVLTLGETIQVGFDAPRSVKILRIPSDLDKWAANAKRRAVGLPPSGSPKYDE